MSLGLRRYILSGLKVVEPVLWQVLLAALLVFFAALPIFDARKRYFSENNLQPNLADFVAEMPAQMESSVASNPGMFVVEGSRATGTDKVLIAVGNETELSKKAAVALARAMAMQRFLSADVEFVIAPREVLAEEVLKRSASGFFRAAVVLDVGCLQSPLCIDTIGNEGLQPNLDIVNVLVSNLARVGVAADIMCHEWGHHVPLQRALTSFPVFDALQAVAAVINVRNPITLRQYLGYFDYLLRSATHKYDPLLALRDRGIHTLVLRSKGNCNEHHLVLARALESLLRSLNNLNERLHHSFFTWFPLDADTFVDYEMSQIVIVLGVATLISRAYRDMQEVGAPTLLNIGLGLSMWPVTALLVAAQLPMAAVGIAAAGTLGVALARGWRSVFVVALYVNAVSLCLLMSIHPAAGKLFSVVAPLQLVLLRKRVVAFGVLAATVGVAAFGADVLMWFVAAPIGTGQFIVAALSLSNAALGSCRVVAGG